MRTTAFSKTVLRPRYRSTRGIMLAAGIAAFCSLMVLTHASEQTIFASDVVSPTGSEAQDFSRFEHSSAQHKRMPCLVCHVRSGNSTTPKMPGHIPCASCHAQQFAEGNSSPICAICHTATDVKSFPPL